jgi:hypothetical protein
MAKIDINLGQSQSDVLYQGDVIVINWKDGTQSSYIVHCFSEPHKDAKKALCSLDGGCTLYGYTDLRNMTAREFQQRVGIVNKVTVIKKENLHMAIEDMSK